MKMSKNIVLLSITILTLIGLVALATYSYFTASTNVNNKITTNVKMPLRPTFTVSGGGEMALTITRNLTLKENAYNGAWSEKSYKTITKNLVVTLTGEPGTTCTYNVYYKDVSSNGSYVYSRTGSNIELELYLIRNDLSITGSFDYRNISQTSAGVPKITPMLGGSTAPFNKAKPVITVPTGGTSVTDNWMLRWNYYNHNYDQSALAGKTFKGELYVDDVVCT